jgi:transposase
MIPALSGARVWLAAGYPAPAACPCCGGTTLRKFGEDVTETLELIPRQWKVIQHVREKFSCRACEAISQPPAPHAGAPAQNCSPISCFSKYGLHLPLNRQSASMCGKALILMCRRWPTGWVPRRPT